ncbi:MAG: hypothetical protein WD602_05345 [Actinomycetota bacterium]
MKSRWIQSIGVLGALALLVSCASEGGQPDGEAQPPAGEEDAALPNACPQEGCRVSISAAEQVGDELELTLDANFEPDLARNHFHVYWDTYDAEQVSDDAERRFGVTQGDWVPTDENPYRTGDAASMRERSGSMAICVTAGDGDHNVIDPEIAECFDVTGFVDS